MPIQPPKKQGKTERTPQDDPGDLPSRRNSDQKKNQALADFELSPTANNTLKRKRGSYEDLLDGRPIDDDQDLSGPSHILRSLQDDSADYFNGVDILADVEDSTTERRSRRRSNASQDPPVRRRKRFTAEGVVVKSSPPPPDAEESAHKRPLREAKQRARERVSDIEKLYKRAPRRSSQTAVNDPIPPKRRRSEAASEEIRVLTPKVQRTTTSRMAARRHSTDSSRGSPPRVHVEIGMIEVAAQKRGKDKSVALDRNGFRLSDAGDVALKHWKAQHPNICCICYNVNTPPTEPLQKHPAKQSSRKGRMVANGAGSSSSDSDDSDDDDDILVCSGSDCATTVHRQCYGLERKTIQFLCDRCNAEDPDSALCVLCPYRDGALKRIGNSDDDGFVHLVCALWIKEVGVQDQKKMAGFVMNNIDQKRWTGVCSICSTEGNASFGCKISCDAHGCKKMVHVSCAQNFDVLEEVDDDRVSDPFFSYCPQHGSKDTLVLNRWAKWANSKYGVLERIRSHYEWDIKEELPMFSDFRAQAESAYATHVYAFAQATRMVKSSFYRAASEAASIESQIAKLAKEIDGIETEMERTEKCQSVYVKAVDDLAQIVMHMADLLIVEMSNGAFESVSEVVRKGLLGSTKVRNGEVDEVACLEVFLWGIQNEKLTFMDGTDVGALKRSVAKVEAALSQQKTILGVVNGIQPPKNAIAPDISFKEERARKQMRGRGAGGGRGASRGRARGKGVRGRGVRRQQREVVVESQNVRRKRKLSDPSTEGEEEEEDPKSEPEDAQQRDWTQNAILRSRGRGGHGRGGRRSHKQRKIVGLCKVCWKESFASTGSSGAETNGVTLPDGDRNTDVSSVSLSNGTNTSEAHNGNHETNLNGTLPESNGGNTDLGSAPHDTAHELIACGDCGSVFHWGCLVPPLTTTPARGYVWLCDACIPRIEEEEDTNDEDATNGGDGEEHRSGGEDGDEDKGKRRRSDRVRKQGAI